jgi:hypothetical protein
MYTLTALFGRFGFRKTVFGLRPLHGFAPPHFCNPVKPSVLLIRVAKTSYTMERYAK